MSLADTYIEIKPRVAPGFQRDVERQMGRTDGSKAGRDWGESYTRGVASGMSGIAKVATKAMKVGVLGAAGAIATAATVTVTKGFQRLVAIDEATGKLKGLGHSAASVKQIMTDALASVKGTAFGLGDAATQAANLVAAGIKPGKELERTLKLLADTATITGTDLGDVGAIFGKVAASGKLTTEVLQQLQERGVPVLGWLAKGLGVSQEQAQKLISEGKVGWPQFQAAMEKGLGGAAKSSGNTFTGAMKNVGAALSRVGAAFLGSAFKQMPGMFADLIKWLDKITPAAEKAGKWFGEKLKVGIDKAREAIRTFKEQFSGGKDLLTGGGGMAILYKAEQEMPFVDKLESAVEAIKTFWAQWQLGVGPGGEMKTFFEDLGTVISTLGGYFWDVVDALAGWVAEATSDEEDISTMGQLFRDIGTAVSGLAGFLADHPALVNGLVTAYYGLAAAMTAANLAAAIHTGVMAANTWAHVASMSTIGTWLGVKALEAGAWIASIAGATAHALAMGASAVATGIATAATTIWTAATWLATFAMAALTAPITLVVLAIAAVVAAIIYAWKNSEQFRDRVTGAWETIKQAGETLKNHLREGFRQIVMFFLDMAGRILDGATLLFGWIPGVGDKLREAQGAFRTFRDNVNESLGGVKDKKVTVTAAFEARKKAGVTGPGGWVGSVRVGAKGGPVNGGEPGKDSVPYLLMPGEFIVDRLGKNLAQALTFFGVPGMAAGGVIRRRQGIRLATTQPSAKTIDTRADKPWVSVLVDVGSYILANTKIEEGAKGLLAFARWLQSKGYHISEHPLFGGVTRGAHVPGSWHYKGQAIDVNADNFRGGEVAAIDRIWRFARAYGLRTIWRSPGHWDHAHFDTSPGANIVGATRWRDVYDLGGILRPGRLGLNRTTRPERILSPEQTSAFDRLVARLLGEEPSGPPARPMRLHPDDIRAIGAELRRGMEGANYASGRAAGLYGRIG